MKGFPSLSFFEGKKILLLCHAGTDVDSIASAATFLFSLKKNKQAVIGVPDHISLHAKNFAEKTSIKYTINPSLEGFDIICLFDLSSPEMLGSYMPKVLGFSGKIFVFDHHTKTTNALLKKSISLIDENAASCTEVVFSWLKKSGAKISQKSAFFAACGLIVDSGKFSFASKDTFSIMDQALRLSKKKYNELFLFFEEKKDLSERIARLKAARRARIYSSNEKIIATATVNAFEPSSAMSLVFLGAEIAFAGGEKNGKIVISGRALNSFVTKSGFDLSRHVFSLLSQKFEGTGGGHAGAAAFNGSGFDVKNALRECVDLSHEFLDKAHGKKTVLKEFD